MILLLRAFQTPHVMCLEYGHPKVYSITRRVVFFSCQLQAEVQSLEEMKLQNIVNVIEAMRSEIAMLWEKCFFSTDQRQAFLAYFSGE